VNALASSLIAVAEDVVGSDIGAIVWWKLSGDVSADRLTVALGGLPGPALPSPDVALRRGVKALAKRNLLVRSIKGEGWALVSEDDEGIKGLVYASPADQPRVKLDIIGRLYFSPHWSCSAEAKVRDAFTYHQEWLDSDDISPWLIDQATMCGAVPLRDGGGVYFVPAGDGLRRWKEITAALTSVSASSIYTVRAMRSDGDAVRSAIDGLTGQIEEEVAKRTADAISGTLGVRALNNRANEARDLARKVRQYESLLGANLGKLVDSLDQLDTQIAAAVLAAEAQAEEDANG